MDNSIIVALITGACAVLGNFLLYRTQAEKNASERAASRAAIEERMKAIEKKLDIHNGYAEKLGDVQQDIAVIRAEIKHLSNERRQ